MDRNPSITAFAPDMVDVAFELFAASLPAHFEWPIYRQLVRRAPWLAGERAAGMHPLRTTADADGRHLLARRTRLVVRMPRDRACSASVLEGASLDLGGDDRVRLGVGTLRPLAPAPTLYSPHVVTGDADEARFCANVRAQLAALGIRASIVCGRRSHVRLDGRDDVAFGLAVHSLDDSSSLRLQSAGLGDARAIGCGLFVPHKTIATAG